MLYINILLLGLKTKICESPAGFCDEYNQDSRWAFFVMYF